MPPKKPSTLNVRHDNKQDLADRAKSESMLTPKTELTLKYPPALNKHKVAIETWKRIVGLYLEVEGKIATSFDSDILAKYCLLEEELIELSEMRAVIKKEWETNLKQANKIKPTAETLKDWVKMWDIVNALFQRFQGIDARLDGKRKLLHTLSQSLYLTPRARAGVEPPMKPEPEPPSEMENLLGQNV